MRKQLEDLRRVMKDEGIDAYIIPTADFHGSEYVNEYFKCREFVSGFTGSAGTLLVTSQWAGLWTDGRYFLQAEAQLSGSGIQLMREREPGVPAIDKFLKRELSQGSCLGFDGRVVSFSEAARFEDDFKLRWDIDLTEEIWNVRPKLCPSQIYDIPLSVTGETSESKLQRLRGVMKEKDADMHLITSLEEIAWLYNLRGKDVEHAPVFFAFLVIEPEGEKLYLLDDTFKESSKAAVLPDTTEVLPYYRFFADLGGLPAGRLILSKDRVSYAIVKSLPDSVEQVDTEDPAEMMKAIKNETEISSTMEAHMRDGAAVTRFIYWIKSVVNFGGLLTEAGAANMLLEFRRKQKGFDDLSFSTIAAYGANGAIVHYIPEPETCMTLQPEGFLLLDSGGQYDDGTTDITRTIALGTLTEDMKRHYTLVLKSHIALASARFPEGTTGAQLDKIARKPLADEGLDFNHGTGHGVGHLLSVHEGPNKISPLGGVSIIREGMITSDEPGLYFEGQYGIRLENEILCVRGEDGMLEFEPITWCPWEREAILPEMLTETEKDWINRYHREVGEKLQPLLDEKTGDWLKTQTEEI
ncbi:MAG: aminopeptidase P family protein [Anaerovoracaceae bacterium]